MVWPSLDASKGLLALAAPTATYDLRTGSMSDGNLRRTPPHRVLARN
jgi:hypothetical protein